MPIYRRHHRTAHRWFLLIICGLLLFQPAFARAQQPKPSADPITTESKDATETKGSKPKVSTALQTLASRYARERQPLAVLAKDVNVRTQGERVQVQVRTAPDGQKAAMAAMQAVGGDVTGATSDGALVQGWLPVTAIDALAAHSNALFIEQPSKLVPLAGSKLTGGLSPLGGQAWQNLGYTGKNIKIGIIDMGFTGYINSKNTGDLPPGVIVKNFVDGQTDAQMELGDVSHGTSCAEIVFDIAPGATLYLVKIDTTVDVDEAVTWMISQGIKIVSSSIGGYHDGPGDGTGVSANIVQRAFNSGIVWVQAAGNDREYHWAGAYSDNDNDKIHSFVANNNATEENSFLGIAPNKYLFLAKDTFEIRLRWDDWSGAPKEDYDLYLLRFNTATNAWVQVAKSDAFQNGGLGQRPTEGLNYTVPDSEAGSAYAVRIKRFAGIRTTVHLDMFALAVPDVAGGAMPQLQQRVFKSSLTDMADSPAAFTVGAVAAAAPFGIKSYSAEGPTTGPGGTELGGKIKPDIAAYVDVMTTTDSSFNGTSAAAPHVAGAAALVAGAHPTWTIGEIRSYLESNAVDLGSFGKDTRFGAGRLKLGMADYVADFDNKEAPAANNAWTLNAGATDTATGGKWAKGQPIETTVNGNIFQRGLNPSDPGPLCLVTGLLGGAWDANDVDGGTTSMRSPSIAVPGGKQLKLSFQYYLSYDSNAVYSSFNKDYFQVSVGANGGKQVVFSELPASGWKFGAWTNAEVLIGPYAADTTIYIEIEAADSNAANVIEAAFDNVRLISN